jgi:hypothetical protein
MSFHSLIVEGRKLFMYAFLNGMNVKVVYFEAISLGDIRYLCIILQKRVSL